MDIFFINENISEVQEDFLYRVLDLGMDFMRGKARGKKVLEYVNNNELRKLFSSKLPHESSDLETLFNDLTLLTRYSISQSDPRFLAFPDSAGSLATYAADILKSFLNQNLIAVDRSAPAATFIEAQLIAWLRYLIGYSGSSVNNSHVLSELGGMWTSGGNMSNHIAILTAMLHKFPEVLTHGLYKLKKRPVMILSKGIAHYSFLNAAKVLGLGSEGILWLDSNDDFKTSVESLVHLLDNIPEDVEPFMIVAVAGNCRTSSIDDIEKMAVICKEKNIWFHVDACHGGSLLFSKKLKNKLNGIQNADSVTIDPHKGLFVTYSSSYVLFKDTNALNNYCRYIEMVSNDSVYDIGLITPFYGSRGFDSLKLWLLIRHMGIKKIGESVEKRNKLFQKLIDELTSLNLFIFLNQPEFYRSAFVFYPTVVQEYFDKIQLPYEDRVSMIQKYTIVFSEILYKRGKVVLDVFKLTDFSNSVRFGNDISYNAIGLSMGHVEIEKSTWEEIINEITYVGSMTTEKLMDDLSNKFVKINSAIVENFKLKSSVSPASW